MIRALKYKTPFTLYHLVDGTWTPGPHPKMHGTFLALHGDCTDIYGDCTNLSGDCTFLSGDCSDLRGDCTRVHGHCTGVVGNFDDCKLTDHDREYLVDIRALIDLDTTE